MRSKKDGGKLDPSSPSTVNPRSPIRRLPLTLIAVTLAPALLCADLWAEVSRGTAAQAWDGSGHYALAQTYAASTFPDTFGWTHAYFAGMGFPNFYPPLFYWLVALLHRTGLVPFDAAFKLVLVLPTLLLPAALWLLGWRLSGKNRLTAACAAAAALPLLVDYRFTNSLGVMGLSYTSTFLLGLYTQALGFVLLAGWYVLYTSERFARPWRAALAAGLLALALLANFFGATVAALFVVTTLAADAAWLARAISKEEAHHARRSLLAHLASALAGLALTLFWLVPLLNAYDYVVTRPHRTAVADLVPGPLWLWYALAAAGALLWLRRPARAVYPFLSACALMAAAVFFAAAFAPAWFPFHPQRLASTFNFLLAAPVGNALAAGLSLLGFDARAPRPHASKPRRGRAGGPLSPLTPRVQDWVSAAILLPLAAIALFALLSPPDFKLAFYAEAERARVAPLLDFAGQHRDGRYLVENQPFHEAEAAHDGRAISALLGAQGNASLSLFFREGAPNVLFLNPLADALSPQPDSYGLSSVLVDDVEFARQTLASHLERARFFGAKYIVVRAQVLKERLAAERSVAARHDFGQWSVFELAGAAPVIRALTHKPAFVVSDLTLKLRQRTDYGFTRLAEEQFASGWYDVALTLSPEQRLDRLEVPEGFGALVVDTYEYRDEDEAFTRLRAISRSRPLILLSADSALFRRIRAAPTEFPRAEIIERPREEPGGPLDSDRPTRSYDDSAVRNVWKELQASLERNKEPTGVEPARVAGALESRAINISSVPEVEVPVLIGSTYHPNWRRMGGGSIYAASPFFMLTFARGPVKLVFARGPLEIAAACVSATTLLLLCVYTAWRYRTDMYHLPVMMARRTRRQRRRT